LLLAALPLSLGRAAEQPASTEPAKSAKAAGNTSDLFGDSVVAKGKTFEIKRSQLDDEVIRLKSNAAAQGRAVPPEQSAMLERQVLDQLIQIQLLMSKATEADKTSGKELAEKKLQEVKTQLGSDEVFDRKLKAEGITRAQLLAKWTEGGTAEAIVKRELKVNLTDDEAKKYYEDNPSKFEQPEMVRVSHILFSTKDPNDANPDPSQKKDIPEDQKKAKRKQAEDVLKQAKAGEDFTKLVKEFSEDPGKAQNNGEYKFSRDDPFVPEFKAAAFSLTTNQISDIVTTLFGYHILKLWEKIPAKKESLAGADTKTIYRKPDGSNITIREILSDDSLRKQFPEYIQNLKKEANVEILDEKLKAADEAPAAPNIPPPRPSAK
jgi:parvulin-like peptidyl-prolyl isomerase